MLIVQTFPNVADAAEGNQTDFANLEGQRHQAETENIKEFNKDMEANRELRQKYARWVFRYLICYSMFVGVLLLGSGLSLPFLLTLPESVVSFLVGSTAASAIGLVLAVTVGLFRPKIGNVNASSV